MSKEREEEVEEQEGQEVSPEDNQPEVSVEDKGGEQVVDVRPSRKERRERERADEIRKLIEESQKPLRDQLAMMAQMSRQAPTTVVAAPAVAPAPAGANPEWKRLVKEQERIVSLTHAATTPAEIQNLNDEWHDTEYRKNRIVADEAANEKVKRFREENPPAENPVHKLVRSEFQDVMNDGPDATAYASSLFTQEKIKAFRDKRPFDDMATHRKVLQQTAEDFGLRQKPLPPRNAAQQGRFASISPSGTGTGGPAPTRALTKEEKQMAIARAEKGTQPAKAYADWAKEMGPEYFRET